MMHAYEVNNVKTEVKDSQLFPKLMAHKKDYSNILNSFWIIVVWGDVLVHGVSSNMCTNLIKDTFAMVHSNLKNMLQMLIRIARNEDTMIWSKWRRGGMKHIHLL